MIHVKMSVARQVLMRAEGKHTATGQAPTFDTPGGLIAVLVSFTRT
jgi:hypothetical protein